MVARRTHTWSLPDNPFDGAYHPPPPPPGGEVEMLDSRSCDRRVARILFFFFLREFILYPASKPTLATMTRLVWRFLQMSAFHDQRGMTSNN